MKMNHNAVDNLLKNAPHVSRLSDPAIRQQLAEANIVLGFDVSTSEHQVFFGRDALERISRSGQSEGSFIAAFKYDSGTTELEFLYAAVKHIKGSCDYETKRTGGMGSGIKVRVYDPEKRTCRLIPAAELAPGYVAAKVPTVDGTVYLNGENGFQKPVRLHEDLSDECKRVIHDYVEATKQIDVRTFDEHLGGFCTNHDPRSELKVHFHIAQVYVRFAKHKILSINGRKDLLFIATHCSLAEPHTAMETLDLNVLTLKKCQVQDIVRFYYDCDWEDQFRKRFDPEKMTPIPAPPT